MFFTPNQSKELYIEEIVATGMDIRREEIVKCFDFNFTIFPCFLWCKTKCQLIICLVSFSLTT